MRLSFKRVFDDKRRMIVPVLAGLVLNIILYVGVVYPMSVRVRSAEQREQAAANALLAAEREDAAARDTVQGRDRTQSALQAFYHDVLPTDLPMARQNLHLRLAKLAEQHNLESGRRHYEPAKDREGSLARLRSTMSLRGDYDDIRRFIYQVESGTDFVVIDSIALTQDTEAGSSLTLTLELSTYYRRANGA
jgi:Tfp pilus assembly protein PilO